MRKKKTRILLDVQKAKNYGETVGVIIEHISGLNGEVEERESSIKEAKEHLKHKLASLENTIVQRNQAIQALKDLGLIKTIIEEKPFNPTERESSNPECKVYISEKEFEKAVLKRKGNRIGEA